MPRELKRMILPDNFLVKGNVLAWRLSQPRLVPSRAAASAAVRRRSGSGRARGASPFRSSAATATAIWRASMANNSSGVMARMTPAAATAIYHHDGGQSSRYDDVPRGQRHQQPLDDVGRVLWVPEQPDQVPHQIVTTTYVVVLS